MNKPMYCLRKEMALFYAILVLLGAILIPLTGHSEGTKQVRPDSTISAAALMIDWSDVLFTRFCMVGCPANYRLNIHIKNVGEKILFGFKTPYTSIGWALKRPDGTIPAGMSGTSLPMSGAGYITYYKQAIKGPFPASGGYTPLQCTADMTGDWFFEITDVHDDLFPETAIFPLWDFQVVTGANTPALPSDTLNGRVWSKSWQMYAKLETPNYFNGSLYVYTDDGIVTKLVCNTMGMGEGTFFCNSVGCVNTGNFSVDRQSKNTNTFVGYPAIAQYKVFLNNPDTSVYPNGEYGILNSVTYNNDPNEPCSWNKFFTVNVNKPGKVVIKIDVPYGDESYDVFLVSDVSPGNNTIIWNGLDGQGNPVPNGTVLTITVEYLNGLTNLPLWDIEGNPGGFKVYPIRPIGPGLLAPLLYWDDSQLTPTYGTTPCSSPPNTVNLTGCVPASTICHDWPQTCHDKMVNTWWYSGSTSSAQVVIFNAQDRPTITGLPAVCPNTNGVVYTTDPGKFNYFWTVSAGGTITSGQGTNRITVNWGAVGNETVSVTYTGTNGCPSLQTIKNVTISNNIPVSVTIKAYPNPVCLGDTVTVTASPVNGGTIPFFQWKVNGINVGTNDSVFRFVAANNDVVTCVLTSNLGSCVTGNPATSNAITITAKNPLTPVITIVASSNPVCAGDQVTFTATPTNGGSSPSYQWQVNHGSGYYSTGTNSPTFTYYPSNGDRVRCILTSSLWCAFPVTATSNVITITVNARPVPTITRISGTNPTCEGFSVSYRTESYNVNNWFWTISSGGTITGGQGTRQLTVFWNTAGTHTVSVTYCNNVFPNFCCAITPTVYTQVVNPRPVPTITGPSSACLNSTGNIYTTEPGMSGYSWTISGGTITAGGGTNSIKVTWNTAGTGWVRVTYTNSFGCAATTPTQYNVAVKASLPVSVSIAPSVNPVCEGTPVTFTATPTNEGAAPFYEWMVNGIVVGTGSPTYTYTPVNGDRIRCVLTSSLSCAIGNPATSNEVVMVVNPMMPVSVSITASPNPICQGDQVTFTAVPVNGGPSPSYQWKVNGVNQGTNSSTYTFTPINGQVITCVLTSNISCPTGNPATSNAITIIADVTAPVISGLPGPGSIECPNTPVFTTPTVTDEDPSPTVTFSDNTVAGTCPQEYVITRTWTATDACGNISTASQTIRVEDNTAPVISALPGPSTMECPATSSFTNPTVTDACDPAPSLTYHDVTSPGSCPQEYSITRTWTATDACGNTSTASQTINVEDHTAPVITGVPPAATIECPSTPIFATLTVTDACDPAPSLTYNDITTPGSCPQEYSVTRTWTAEDACGNSSTASQTITVEDITAPVITTTAASGPLGCNPTITAPVFTGTDNCEG
ncbi:MAG TPA: hypothetical protein PKJ28_09770, partial [Bacteroidales bacterium]|nr:hypothetical protein [Bacteroidales bacterium]